MRTTSFLTIKKFYRVLTRTQLEPNNTCIKDQKIFLDIESINSVLTLCVEQAIEILNIAKLMSPQLFESANSKTKKGLYKISFYQCYQVSV